MNLMFSRSLNGYLHEPSTNDGIIILHILPEDADTMEAILPKYGFEVKRTCVNDQTIYTDLLEQEKEELINSSVEEKTTKKRKRRKKSSEESIKVDSSGQVELFDSPQNKDKPSMIWVNYKGIDRKKISPEEFPKYEKDGWTLGRGKNNKK